MSRKSSSQWEFGELFPAAETRRVLTISEITGQIRRSLEKDIGEVWVTGEVTNFRLQASGHAYFTLKDAAAQLSCVLFRGTNTPHREHLEDGRKLVAHGALTVYEPRGQYQLVVRAIEPQGLGALQLAFARLKQKLEAEGLFAPERKRALPRYPQRLGLVTSPTGAAIRDVLHVIQRRQPSLEIVLAPCRVQGEGAGAEVAAGVRLLNEWNERVRATDPAAGLDLILVTRGGGSMEDLWAFNEEDLARAIFESHLPVVSAVGHEIDYTISDFVADLRAATPSAAAEQITEGAFASRQFVARARQRLARLALARLARDRQNLTDLARRFVRGHPRRQVEDQMQHLDELQAALFRHVRQGWRERQINWTHLQQRLHRARPAAFLRQRRELLARLAQRLSAGARRRGRDLRVQIDQIANRLRLLSPDSVLARGYSLTLDAATGTVVRQARQLRSGQRLRTRLQSGEVTSVVEGPSGRVNDVLPPPG